MTSDVEEFIQSYKKELFKSMMFIVLVLAMCVFAFGMALGFGTFHIGFVESYKILYNKLAGIAPSNSWESKALNVMWSMRLPRAIGSLAIGAGLGVCGCAMQSSLKNPLADPYTTGISSGASLGASLAIILGITMMSGGFSEIGLISNAFFFALIPSAIIISMTAFKKRITTTAIILIGVAVMYTFSAITTFLKYIATDDSLQELYFWSLGSLGKIDWDNVGFLIIATLFGLFFFQMIAKDLNVLSMTDNNAGTMGVNTNRARVKILIVVSFVTAVMVCFTGTIGFVGLIAPHVARIIIGNNNKYLIPASAATGAFVLIAADCVAKNLTATGMPIGVVTSIIGGPLFLLLLLKQRKAMAW